MRLLYCLPALFALLSPLAQAELLDDIWERGSLRIALEDNNPPYSYREGGKLVGFDVELGRALAAELNVEADFVVDDGGKMPDGLQSGRYDIALDQFEPSEEGQDTLEFSEPYLFPQAEAVGESGAGAPMTIPFQKGNPAFRDSLNRALTKLRSERRLGALSEQWLGKDLSQAPAAASR
ncbi:transporter substrate-binding domain-containing protein [Pseudomonas resinovorans]|uniref:transporter substrate-binding domain-containing protein n=1 Tax=Metapseudomonas resinovorans TaxID=53412 RepID=UPI00237EEC9B|nr:transporter substrate-binding domain-containing protein [Pseudomonas resinovorans]MDE3737136.1 transporter substrate-binding domain-containing protein [Pseudomonas resinovorans]